MNIELGNIRITSDEHNFIIEESSIIKESKYKSLIGTKAWKAIGFYGSMESLLNGLMKHRLLKDDITCLQDLIKSTEAHRVIVSQIRDAFKTVTK